MLSTQFLHKDPDVFHDKELTLHDCRANMISYESNVLRFYMPDGFWITPHHEANDREKTLRTDTAVVELSIEDVDDVTVRVFTRKRGLFSSKTIVESWNITQLISAVNSGKCTLEFITQYRSHHEQMWHCAIWSEKKPYYKECQLYFPNCSAFFCWNRLSLDREW